jgi:hypothetical protein
MGGVVRYKMGCANGKQIVAQLSQFIGIKMFLFLEPKNVNNCWNTKITFYLEHLVAKILICISIFLYFFYFLAGLDQNVMFLDKKVFNCFNNSSISIIIEWS